MTSQNTSIYTPFSDGHTVRDIVEHTPALVNEAWCRTLLRHTLDSLEQQYASGAPHRPITPDTLVMLANGETLLLPAAAESPEAEQNLAADLRALALVVHYAITAEFPPEGPLGPRLYDNYTDQLTRGLDSCLGPNRRLRPTTVENMRTLLGIEAGTVELAAPAPVELVEPPAAVEPAPTTEAVTTAPLDPIVISPEPAAPRQEAADPVSPEPVSLREQAEAGMLRKPANRDPDAVQAPRSAEKIAPGTSILHDNGPVPAAPRKPSAGIPPPAPDQARADAGMQPATRRNSSAQRWGMIAGAALVVLAAGGALFSWMQQNDERDVVPLALPPAERPTTGLDAGETVVAAPGATTAPAQAAATQPGDAALNGAPGAPGPAPATAAPPAGAAPQAASQAAADEAIVNGTTYKLLIKPWGTVYVDGVDRGVSPPVKRLTLAPGQHTLRIVNPNFPDHVVTVDAGIRESATIQYDFRAQAR